MQTNASLPNINAGTFSTSPSLPVGQLESLRSKINQMIDSIQTLQRTVEAGGYNAMPAWPDILSKYTMLLSQSHNLSMSLVGTYAAVATSKANGVGPSHPPTNPYERLALHPSVVMTDAQLDNELIPLLRNQQTTDVLKLENETVRHLAEHMATRGSLGVLAVPPQSSVTPAALRPSDMGTDKKIEYTDVLAECEQIRMEHDERIERAINAVVRLRNEKYEWKVRVEVEQEEPEELEWDPRLGDQLANGGVRENETQGQGSQINIDEESNDSEEEEELEEVLGNGDDDSPGRTPEPTSSMHQG
ncbi:hypothetical protein BC835DRAFT_1279787 [Cytidiella melzeri]|nr:hypothetical protein BC835DRAFT_1279787 [Cytidiella melzeri]